jgi:indoleamine 2,3-dioxygenase
MKGTSREKTMASLETGYRVTSHCLSSKWLRCEIPRRRNYSPLLTLLAHSAGFKPFMEYAGSYALFNYRLVDPKQGLEYSNLRLIRAFEHGLDPTSSEAGFVLVHVAMVKHSGLLVSSAADALDACAKRDRDVFNDAMRGVVNSLKRVNGVMNGM